MDKIKETRQAGDLNSGGAEIVVTPEMIRAGVGALSQYACYEDFDFSMNEIVQEIYSSMLRASLKPGTRCKRISKLAQSS